MSAFADLRQGFAFAEKDGFPPGLPMPSQMQQGLRACSECQESPAVREFAPRVTLLSQRTAGNADRDAEF